MENTDSVFSFCFQNDFEKKRKYYSLENDHVLVFRVLCFYSLFLTFPTGNASRLFFAAYSGAYYLDIAANQAVELKSGTFCIGVHMVDEVLYWLVYEKGIGVMTNYESDSERTWKFTDLRPMGPRSMQIINTP